MAADTQAELTVQKQLEAYNARDIEAFMEWWADDCQYFEFPAKLLANGAAEIRARHIARFKEPNLFGRLIKRMVIADMVVDQETVTRTFPEGLGEIDVMPSTRSRPARLRELGSRAGRRGYTQKQRNRDLATRCPSGQITA